MPEALLSVRKAMKPKIYHCVVDLDPVTDPGLQQIGTTTGASGKREAPGDHCLQPSLDAPGPQHWL